MAEDGDSARADASNKLAVNAGLPSSGAESAQDHSAEASETKPREADTDAPFAAQSKNAKKRLRAPKKDKKSESAVVYLSRVPPGLDVGAARALLSRTGTLGRVWLRAEDAGAVAARRQLGGRRRGGFSDGWVEYTCRRDAKNAVALLNGQPMAGAKRGGRWKNDLWNLRLLPRGYSWDDLVEETCGSKRERVLRVKAAVAASRREKAFVEERAELAKRIAAKEKGLEEAESDGEDHEMPRKGVEKRIVRRFRQREAVADMDYEDDVDERRAREAARRLENDEGEGPHKKAKVDTDLVAMLFGKKGSPATAEKADATK